MNRVAQHPVQAFVVALAAVAVLSIMDAVMKHLVLAIGIFAVSVWRALANLAISAALYLPRRNTWPDRATLRIHVARAVVVTVMAFLFFWGIGRVPLAQAIASDLHRPADRAPAGGDVPARADRLALAARLDRRLRRS